MSVTTYRIVEAGHRITAIEVVCEQARAQDADDLLQRSPDQALWVHAKELVGGADIRLLAKDVLHNALASHLVHVYSTGTEILCTVAERRRSDRWRIVGDRRLCLAKGRLLVDMMASDEAVRLASEVDGIDLADTDRLAAEISEAIWHGHLRPDQAAALVESSERRVYA